jgi:hypothetical protein
MTGGFVLIRDSLVIVPEGDRRAVVFPIVLNPSDRKDAKTYWIKAIVDHQAHVSTNPGDDAALIEAMLKKALSQVQSEADAPSQAEDSSGTITVSENVGRVLGARHRCRCCPPSADSSPQRCCVACGSSCVWGIS